jgi:BirA family transcriptional regulator, biotin operon repressor / biotin---[acetyl-CoA-carboxylase] ligase
MDRIVDQETICWPFVRTAVAYDTVDSTSDRAAELVRESRCTLPLVVWARRQTRGRGRGAHEWWSDAGSLTLTLALDPLAHGLAVAIEPKLALATAVAVIEALNELNLGSPSLGIRWPNDLEFDGKKLGGILPERVETQNGHLLLVGIGLNVDTNLAGAPAEVRALATSLAALQGKPLDKSTSERLIPPILSHFESVVRRLASGDPSLVRQWDRLDLLREKWVCVDLGTRRVAGWGQGIDHHGALCLDNGHERVQIFGGQVIRDCS